MTDDPFHDRVREQLDVAYREAPLRPGSLAATARAGRRRQHRRRRVGAASAAAAVGVCGATVAWLSRPANPRVDTVDRPTTPTSGPTPETDGPAIAGITLTTAEPALTWRRIDPDSTAAVAGSLEASYAAAPPSLPGVMLSTAPGRSPQRRLWRSDDGITWSQIVGLPDGATAADSWTGTGGRIYALGTMPGTAPGTYGAYVSTSPDGGLTWNGEALATDNPEMVALPGVEGVSTRIVGVTGAGDVVLAAGPSVRSRPERRSAVAVGRCRPRRRRLGGDRRRAHHPIVPVGRIGEHDRGRSGRGRLPVRGSRMVTNGVGRPDPAGRAPRPAETVRLDGSWPVRRGRRSRRGPVGGLSTAHARSIGTAHRRRL